MAGNEIKVGTYVGTGAAITLSLGFIPDYIQVTNLTDGDARWERYTGMTAAHAITIAADGAQSRITSNGITEFAGSSTAAPGITLGTALSESGDTFGYVAVRNTQ